MPTGTKSIARAPDGADAARRLRVFAALHEGLGREGGVCQPNGWNRTLPSGRISSGNGLSEDFPIPLDGLPPEVGHVEVTAFPEGTYAVFRDRNGANRRLLEWSATDDPERTGAAVAAEIKATSDAAWTEWKARQAERAAEAAAVAARNSVIAAVMRRVPTPSALLALDPVALAAWKRQTMRRVRALDLSIDK